MMNTRFLPSALAATALALPMSAWGEYGVTSRSYEPLVAAPVAPVVPPAAVRPVNMLPPEHAYARGSFSFDIRGFYGFRAVPHSEHATDMAGAEAEFAWYFSPRQAITFGASIGVGGDDNVNYVDGYHGPVPVSEDFTRSDVTFTVGYRFTQPLTRRTSLSLGIKGGLDIQHLSYDDTWAKYHYGYGPGYYGDENYSYGETQCGFSYAASATLETQLTERLQLQLGYQFRGATTKPDAPSVVPGGPAVSADALRWHEVHLGLRFNF